MKKVNNIESFTQVMSVLLTEKFIQGDIHGVCDIIDPYVDAYLAIYDLTPEIDSMATGIHLAFWIMLDERLNFPTDPLVFSNLMSRCFEYNDWHNHAADKLYDVIKNTYDNLSEEQLSWALNLSQLKLVNPHLVLSCLWSLLQIWDYLQKSEELRQEINQKSTS